MTNLQPKRGKGEGGELAPATLKRFWLWTPIVAGGGLSALLLLALAVPQGMEIARVLQHLNDLEQNRQEIEVLELQSSQTRQDRKKAKRQAEQLVRLVTGKGDLATFLATLDLEASQSGVKLELYEPVPPLPAAAGAPGTTPGTTPPPPAASPPPAQGGAPPAAGGAPAVPDAMAKAGLHERTLLLVASGNYPQLLAFLRRMELLDVLVEQKNLTVIAPESQPGYTTTDLPPDIPLVEVRLGLTLWSKEAQTAPGQGALPTPPGAAPPPPARRS